MEKSEIIKVQRASLLYYFVLHQFISNLKSGIFADVTKEQLKSLASDLLKSGSLDKLQETEKKLNLILDENSELLKGNSLDAKFIFESVKKNLRYDDASYFRNDFAESVVLHQDTDYDKLKTVVTSLVEVKQELIVEKDAVNSNVSIVEDVVKRIKNRGRYELIVNMQVMNAIAQKYNDPSYQEKYNLSNQDCVSLITNGLRILNLVRDFQPFNDNEPFKTKFVPELGYLVELESLIYQSLPVILINGPYSFEEELGKDINSLQATKWLDMYEEAYNTYLEYFNSLSNEVQDKIISNFALARGRSFSTLRPDALRRVVDSRMDKLIIERENASFSETKNTGIHL